MVMIFLLMNDTDTNTVISANELFNAFTLKRKSSGVLRANGSTWSHAMS